MLKQSDTYRCSRCNKSFKQYMTGSPDFLLCTCGGGAKKVVNDIPEIFQDIFNKGKQC